eukprot:2063078-Ditylum_brightwellii.AAC.1
MRRGAQQTYQKLAKVVQAGMPIALAFDKGERAGLGRFVKEATYFDHHPDCNRGVSVHFSSDGGKSRDWEAVESIDTALIPIGKYCTNTEKTTAVAQCSDSGGRGTTEEIALDLQAIGRRNSEIYYIAACTLHA